VSYSAKRPILSNSLRAWEYNFPVPIKFIADPSMYALTRSSAHPSGKYVAFQPVDSQIVVYAVGDKFRQNRKKGFGRHNTSRYVIDLAISPDGGLIAGGDSRIRMSLGLEDRQDVAQNLSRRRG
jgi:pre-mRNA-processing factor 17